MTNDSRQRVASAAVDAPATATVSVPVPSPASVPAQPFAFESESVLCKREGKQNERLT